MVDDPEVLDHRQSQRTHQHVVPDGGLHAVACSASRCIDRLIPSVGNTIDVLPSHSAAKDFQLRKTVEISIEVSHHELRRARVMTSLQDASFEDDRGGPSFLRILCAPTVPIDVENREKGSIFPMQYP